MVRFTPQAIALLLAGGIPLAAQAELVALQTEELSAVNAASGVELDIDISSLAFSYNYKNTDNPNEHFWVSGHGTGGDKVIFYGISIDVVDFGSSAALAIGMPTTVDLDNVNTGDYFIARERAPGDLSPPNVDTSNDRKLFGLAWNTNITGPGKLDFPQAAAAGVESYSFANAPFQMDGQVLIFAD